ncbi:MAG TPA: AMP-binding protein [Jatrophihabitantaceae bacterium]|nr:AMP-binding protein [Jatrophihabitantaceae bacterium]
MRHLDLLAGPAGATPRALAVAGSGVHWSFAEVDDRTDRLGRALYGLGLTPGDRVALLAANEPEYLEAQAACLRWGFTLVPLNTRLADPELLFILGDCDPRVLLVGRDQAGRVDALVPQTGIASAFVFGVDGSYEALLAAAPAEAPLPPDDPALLAVILYTSGTTGRPKGAMIDRQAFTARVLVNCAELQVARTDRHLAALPMFHIAAFLAYAHTVVGGAIVMLPDFSPARCLDVMLGEGITTTVLVPTMISMLLAHDGPRPDSLRLIVYGGSSIMPSVLAQAMTHFRSGMLQQYGMTESGAQTILRPADHDPDDRDKLSSAGTEAVSFEVRIVDDADRPLPSGGIGEIVCRAPSVMSGYWNRPEATAETLRGGWMHTGDVGYRDERGYLHITDRRNDTIISGGENVYPREVEAALLDHPGVTDLAVVGTTDPVWGEVVTAFVVEPAPTDEELQAWARERLAGYKIPRRWVRVSDLPRNATGKVLKHELRTGIG